MSNKAQLEANRRWAEKNREYRNYLSKRSNARSFIRNHATDEDLLELQKLINERKNVLKTEKEI